MHFNGRCNGLLEDGAVAVDGLIEDAVTIGIESQNMSEVSSFVGAGQTNTTLGSSFQTVPVGPCAAISTE